MHIDFTPEQQALLKQIADYITGSCSHPSCARRSTLKGAVAARCATACLTVRA